VLPAQQHRMTMADGNLTVDREKGRIFKTMSFHSVVWHGLA